MGLGARAYMGIAIHLEDREKDALSEVRAALIHLPHLNTFIGLRLSISHGKACPWSGDRTPGAASSFSMLRTCLRPRGAVGGTVLHRRICWVGNWPESADGAALGRQDRTLRWGLEAEFWYAPSGQHSAIAQPHAQAEESGRRCSHIMMGRPGREGGVWVGGAGLTIFSHFKMWRSDRARSHDMDQNRSATIDGIVSHANNGDSTPSLFYKLNYCASARANV